MTLLEVVDDAVKIGLGALLGLGSAWILAANSWKQEKEKRYYERQQKVFDECVSLLEKVFFVWEKYTGLLAGIHSLAKSQETKNATEAAIIANQLLSESTNAVNLKTELLEAVNRAAVVQSKFLVLGDKEAKIVADQFLGAVTNGILVIKFDGVTVDLTRFLPVKEEIITARFKMYSVFAESLKS